MSKIFMLLQGTFPPDIRLEKEINSLTKAGHSVFLICNQYDQSQDQSYNNCKIVRIRALTKIKLINKILNFPVIFNPRFLLIVILNYIKQKPDFIHSHDLPMAVFGVVLKWIIDKPLIFDMHENYPEALKAYDKKNLIERIFKNYRVAKVIENYVLKKCDKIITVTDENRQRLIDDGIEVSKIEIISNTVDLESFGTESVSFLDLLEKYQNRFLIVYTGTISANRGLLTAVEAMKFLKKTDFNPLLLIVGEGSYLKELKKAVEINDIENLVEFVKWPGHNQIHSYMRIADVVIIPQPSNGHADTTVPHKLFEYMSQGQKVLVSDAKPLKRIVEETRCGEVFISNNPKSFSEKLIKLKTADINYKDNGISAVNNKYNWAADEKVLTNLYR